MGDSKVKKSKIIKVLENQTNNDYQRRGIITKGAIVETEDGKCRIVSRPGQSGTVSGILVKDRDMKDYEHVVIWLDYFNKTLPRPTKEEDYQKKNVFLTHH